MCGLADLQSEDLGKTAGTSNGNSHHGRPVRCLLHGDDSKEGRHGPVYIAE